MSLRRLRILLLLFFTALAAAHDYSGLPGLRTIKVGGLSSAPAIGPGDGPANRYAI